ncbi:MAG TPA: sigma-70 family RNA polymerase sigma factor, partial [Myxococcota bacterium]|nr:sigma-70 family RNA polymerase sigma factor [Myxococcota bacterium]
MTEADDLEAVYRCYIVMVRNRACRILGDRAAAQDVAQDVFVKFMLRRRNRGAEQDTPSLLYRMATNAALNRLRSLGRRGRALRREGPPPAATDDACDDRLALRAVLARVPEDEALVAAYYYVDGLLQAEIATLLQMERRTVGNRLEAFR